MISLKNKATGKYIGSLTETQLQYLINELEEEHKHDQDYWINRSQIDIFKEKGADSNLIAILELALDGSDEVDVFWENS